MPIDLTRREGFIAQIMRFCLTNKLVVALVVLFVLGWGLSVAPFDWNLGAIPRAPVPVDAIPDTGANQQIVFTSWPGQSPQQIDDQITYPMSSALLSVPKVKAVRGSSMFGFSSIKVIFEDGVDFYWSRDRLREKLGLLDGSFPPGVKPKLGPEATSLGQVFWYTLEGRDKEGKPAGGWDLEELRNVQDWILRDNLKSAGGVSEVASAGGFVREYHVDVDPDAMRAYDVTLGEVYHAVRASNRDVGAKTIELNRVEYFLRGVGYIKNLADIENAVVKVTDNVPILIKHVAEVSRGPALRRGALDKDGAGAVGAVVVAQDGANPLEVINNVKDRIKELAPTLPSKTLEDGTVSQVTIVPFYDRTKLIKETLGTLDHALRDEIMITIIVVVLMVMHLKSSLLIGSLLPLSVLMCFIGMKIFRVDANIVALSGIA
ncbi:MAG: efflux RND transporter permease subunit, partial [bacterium]|nr:efflux RND transporter permease subunit [bacterium]